MDERESGNTEERLARAMTILNFALLEDAVYVMTDTLVTTDGTDPCFFTTKVHVVPHLNGLVAGTGALGFILAWSRHLLGGLLSVDIAHADEFVPGILRGLRNTMPEEFEGERTATIYHFGYDEADRRFVGFAYRSTDDFESEPLAYGVGTKPAFVIEMQGNLGWPDDFIDICEAQKLADEATPPGARVGVGGYLVSYEMNVERMAEGEDFVRTLVTRPHKFADCDTAYATALSSIWEAQERQADGL
jgi:hypothetical protein